VRDGLTAAEVQARMSAQIDPARALAMADFVIENDADLPTLEHRARSVYEQLLVRRPAA
jgi:dephospho-CoA kinase